jgi:hypothetical protein
MQNFTVRIGSAIPEGVDELMTYNEGGPSVGDDELGSPSFAIFLERMTNRGPSLAAARCPVLLRKN